MPRLTNIYTRKGDQGYTSLRNQSMAKDEALVEAVGALDELNAAIGVVLAAANVPEQVYNTLSKIQNDLFDIGGELHLPERITLTPAHISWLEERLDDWNSQLPTLKEFILPRGNLAAASAHLARTICRRAERDMVRLHRQIPLSNPEILRYINRLSDLLFVIARVLARSTQPDEPMWEHENRP